MPHGRLSGSPGAGQFPLPFADVPRTARHRPVSAYREDPAVYAAVIALRESGRRVYRSGGLHKVDGRLLTTAELLRLARNIAPAGRTRP